MSSRQHGFTLVELMVAAVISLILLAGIIHVYTGSKATYRVEEGLSRVQENGRFSLELLGRGIRMAGYQGCSNQSELVPHIKASDAPENGGTVTDLVFDLDDVVNGTDNVATGNGIGSRGARENTDVLVIRGGFPSDAKLAGKLTTNTAQIQLDSNPDDFVAGDYLFITDCESADLFEANSVSESSGITTITHSGSVNTTPKLSKPYLDDAFLLIFNSSTYYIQDSGRVNEAGETIFSLFETNLRDGERELIEGVEDMQITYGRDTDGDGSANQYDDASAVTNWANVVSVRLQLLLGTIQHVSPVAQDFTDLSDTLITVADDDRRLRRRFTTTISLRNRAL